MRFNAYYPLIMQQVQLGALASLVRFGAGAGIFFVWTVIEKQIIEPFGIYQFMPFYRVDGICAWDVLAIIVIAGAFAMLGKRSATEIL